MIHALGKFPALDTMGKILSGGSGQVVGVKNVGILFAETAEWSESEIASLDFFDRVFVGSSWGKSMLVKAG